MRRPTAPLAGSVATLFAAAAFCGPLSHSSLSATYSWTGATGGDWATAGNWSTKPGAGDTALFNTALASVLNASADQSVGSISFDTNAGTAGGSFTIGTAGGNKLTLANAGTIQILATLLGTGKTIAVNSPIVLTPGSTTTAGSYTFSNNSTVATNVLNFGGPISASTTSNTETLTLSGSNTGANTIGGNISNGSAATLAVTKSGAGTWVLSASNSYTGNTTISSGTLQIGAANNIGSSGTLVLNSGVLQVAGASPLTLTNNVLMNANSTIASSQNLTLSGTFSNSGANNSLNYSMGASGTLTLSGPVNLSESSNNSRVLVLVNNTGYLTITGQVQDYSGGVGTAASSIQLNSGTLTLTNNSNNFSGGINVAGGGSTLILGGSGVAGTGLIQGYYYTLQATTPVVLANNFQENTGHTVTVSGSNSISIGSFTNSAGSSGIANSLTGGAALTISGTTFLQETSGTTAGRTLTVGGGANTTFNGPIVNGGTTGLLAGNLTINNTGTTTLNGASTYSGTTGLSGAGGTVVIGNDSAFGNTSGVTIANTVNLQAGGGAHSVSSAIPITLTSNPTINGGNSLNLNGSLTISGTDRTLTSSITNGNTLSLSGTTFLQENTGGTGHTLTVAGSGNTLISGPIVTGGTAGTSNLTINNTGTTTLNGASTYSGTTGLSGAGGTVVIGNDSAFGNTSGVTIANTVNLQAGGGAHSVSSAIPITLTSNPTVNGSNSLNLNGSLTISGTDRTLTSSITGGTLGLAGSVYLSESASNGRTLTLAGSGNTTVSGTIANNSAISGTACNLTVTNTGTTTLSGRSVFTGTFGQTGAGTVSLTGTINGPSGVTVNNAGAVFSESATGAIQGGSTTLNVSAGMAILLGANSYGGATTVYGILQLGDGTPGHDPTLATSGIANNSQVRFNYNANQTIGSLFSGNGTVWQQGPGMLTVTGSNSAGLVSIISGTLQVGDGTNGHDGPLTASSISDNGVLAYNLYGSGTVAAPISQSGALVKSGPGTLTLTGSNSYTGATTITGGTLQLNDSSIATTSGVLDNGVFVVNANTNPQTYSCAISGSGALVKGGTNTLTLTGSNSYTGLTTITGGTLQIGNGTTTGAIDSSSGIANNGVLAYNFGTGSQASVSNISGAGSLLVTGTGTLTLSASNSYTGNTTISSGTLQIGAANNIGSSGTLVLNGGALHVAGASPLTLANNVLMNANGSTITSAQNVTLSGTFSNSGANNSLNYSMGASGTLTLSGQVNLSESSNNSRVLVLGNNTGYLTITGQVQDYSGGVGTAASSIQVNSGVLTLTNNSNNFSGGINVAGGGSTLILGGNSVAGTGLIQGYYYTLQATTPVVLANNFQENTGHVVTVSGTNSISIGSFTNSAGSSGIANSLTGGAALTISGTTFLQETSGTTAGRTLTVGGGANTTFNGPIVNGGTTGLLAGSLTITNTGTTTLNGANSYTGATTISAGVLSISSDGNLNGTNSALTFNGGTLQITGTALSSLNPGRTTTFASGAIVGFNINNAANSFTVTQTLNQGTGGLLKAGAGTLILTASNSYTGGTVINSGTLTVGNVNALGITSGSLTVNGGALDLSGYSVTVGALSGSSGGVITSGTTGALTLTTGGTGISTFSGVIQNGSATSIALAVSGSSTGSLTLTGSNSYTGGTTLVSGRLQVGNAAALGSGALTLTGGTFSSSSTAGYSVPNAVSINGNVGLGDATNTGLLTFSGNADLNGAARTLTVNSGVTLTGTIGNGALTKAGAGTLTLAGSNSYTGNTTLTGGTLQISAANNIGSSGTLVLNGGALQVAGASPLTLANNVLMNATSTVSGAQNVTLSGTFTNSGGDNQLNDNLTSGTLTLAGTVNLSETSSTGRTLLFNGGGANPITISGVIQNNSTVTGSASGIEIGGNQVLTLTNSSNTFSGGVNLYGSGSVLVLANSGAAGTGLIQGNNSTIQATAPVVLANAVQVNGGSHTMIFSGANSISIGSLTNSAGSSTITNSLTGGAALTISGTTFIQETTGTTAGRTLSIAGSANTTFNGPIVNGGGGQAENLTVTNTGTTTLNGANTYTGGSTINGGILEFMAPAAMPVSGTVTVNNGGTLAVPVGGAGQFTLGTSGVGTIGGLLSGTGGQGAPVTWNSGAALGIDTTFASGTYAAIVTNSGTNVVGLTKLGANTLTLTGSNTYTGKTTVTGGTLKLQGVAFSGTPRAYSIGSGAVMDVDSASSFAYGTTSITGSGTLQITNENFANNIASGYNLTMALGAGGSIDVESGAKITNGGWSPINWAGNLAGLYLNGGTLDLWDGNTVMVDALTGNGTVTDTYSTKTLQVGVNNGSGVFNGSIADGPSHPVALLKSGTGVQTLSGTNSYSGTTTINAGTLQIGNGGTTGSLLSSTVISGSTGGMLTFNRSDTVTVSNTISGGIGLAQVGTGTLTLTGSNNYSGTTTVSAGGLQLGDGTAGHDGSLATSGLVNNAQLTYNLNGNQSASYPISGSGALSKQGPGTLTLTGSNNQGSITVTSGTLQLGDGTAGHDGSLATSGIVNNAQLTYNLNGNQSASYPISGSGALSKQGPGTLTLTGSNNQGSISVTSGTLQLGGGGTTGSINSATISGSSGATLAFNRGDSIAFNASSISGGLSVVQSGSGTLTLTGPIGYTGDTLAGCGTLNLTGSSSASNLIFNATTGVTATVNLSGTTTFASGKAINIGNVFASGAQILNVVPGANITSGGSVLVGCNDSFGTLNMSGGTLSATGGLGQVVVGNNFGNGILNLSGGTVQVLGTISGVLANFGGTTGVMNVSGGSFISTNGSFSGLTVGNGGLGVLNASGTGIVSLGGNSAPVGLNLGGNSGATGIVNLGAAGAGGGMISTMRVVTATNAATSLFNFHGGTLQARIGANSAFFTGLTGAYVYSEGGTIDNNGQSITIGQALLAPGGFGASAISAAASGFMMSGYSTAPLVTISGGSGTGMTANAMVDGNGNLTGFTITNPGCGYASGDTITVALARDKNISGNSSSTSAVTLAAITGGGLTFGGSGTTTLSASNSYTGGTTLNNGTLRVANVNALGTGGLTVNGGALDLNGYSVSVGALSGSSGGVIASSTTGAMTLTTSSTSNSTFAGAIQNGSGTVALTKSGTGTLTLTGSNNYSGTTTVSAGGLQLGDGTAGHDGSLATSGLVNNAQLTYNLNGNQSASYPISGSGGLVKTGPGMLVLSGSNTHSGGTTVSSGTLQVGNANALGTGGLTVNSGMLDLAGNSVSVAAFSGSGGTVTNMASGTSTLTTTVASGTSTYAGNIANGTGAVALTNSGAGTLILSGSLTMAGLNASSGVTQLTQSGSIGAVSVASGATVSVAAHSGSNYYVLNISSLTITGFTSGLAQTNSAAPSAAAPALLNADNVTGAGTAMLAAAGQAAVANAPAAEPASPEAVPEPGALGLLLAGALGMLGFRRQRRNG